MPRIEVVIARLNEDVEWSRSLGWPVTIYTKKELPQRDGFNVIDIPIDNEGREASTWLMHIINNYDNLADYTLFLQGKSNDHCADIKKTANFDKPFTWLANEEIANQESDQYMGVTYGSIYSQLFPLTELPKTFFFGRGGLFMVSREQIHNYPVTYYQTILNFFRNSYSDKIWACYLERFWDKIFQRR